MPNFRLGEPVQPRPGFWSLRTRWPWSEVSPTPAEGQSGRERPIPAVGRPVDFITRLALVTALSVAGLSVVGGVLLVQQTAAHRHALLLMAQVEDRIGQAHVLQRQAILEPRRLEELVARLREARQQLVLDLDTLGWKERRIGMFDTLLRLSSGPSAAVRVRAAVEVQQAAVDEAFALLQAGRLDQAR